MPLSDVAQGDPHVAAHNAERHLINNIQDLSDPTFSSELLSAITAQAPMSFMSYSSMAAAEAAYGAGEFSEGAIVVIDVS